MANKFASFVHQKIRSCNRICLWPRRELKPHDLAINGFCRARLRLDEYGAGRGS